MDDVKIVNSKILLYAVSRINRDTILLKFRDSGYYDFNDEINTIKIHGENASEMIGLIIQYHLHSETVIAEEGDELAFYHGKFDEIENWGSMFSMQLDQYEVSTNQKEIEDWDDQFLSIVKSKVFSKAFQETTSQKFRDEVIGELGMVGKSGGLSQDLQERKSLISAKIKNLDEVAFYAIFMENHQFKLD